MPPNVVPPLHRPSLPSLPVPSLPPALLAALATFVRARLAEVSDTVSLVVVGAAAPFAPTSYSRARLVRQMYASGLLTGDRPAPAVRPDADADATSRYAYRLHAEPERSAR